MLTEQYSIRLPTHLQQLLKKNCAFRSSALFSFSEKFTVLNINARHLVVSPSSNKRIVLKMALNAQNSRIPHETSALTLFASGRDDDYIIPRLYPAACSESLAAMHRLTKCVADYDCPDKVISNNLQRIGRAFGAFCARTYLHNHSLHLDFHTGNYTLEDGGRKIGILDLSSIFPEQEPEKALAIPSLQSSALAQSIAETFSRITGIKLRTHRIKEHIKAEIVCLEGHKGLPKSIIRECVGQSTSFLRAAQRSHYAFT